MYNIIDELIKNKKHSLILTEPGNEQYIAFEQGFNEHQNLLVHCAAANKCGLLFINNNFDLNNLGSEYYILNNTNNLSRLTTTVSALSISGNEASDAIEEIIRLKNKDYNAQTTLIVIKNLEEIEPDKIDAYVTLARSRNICFVIYINDKAKFIKKYGPEVFKIIEANTYNTFVCAK